MNKQSFKKELEVTGINGTFTAELVVIFNYRSEQRTVQNRSLHEEEIKTVYHHVVRGTIKGAELYSNEFDQESSVWKEIAAVEDKLNINLQELANKPKPKSLAEQLIEKGFTQT